MAHHFRIQQNRQVATFLFEGRMTVDMGADIFLAYVRHPGFDPRLTMLTDARLVTEVEASFLTMFRKVTRLAPEFMRFREPVRAVVLVGNDTVFGYVRMLEQILDMTTQIRMMAVWSEEEALAATGLQGAAFSDLYALQA